MFFSWSVFCCPLLSKHWGVWLSRPQSCCCSSLGHARLAQRERQTIVSLSDCVQHLLVLRHRHLPLFVSSLLPLIAQYRARRPSRAASRGCASRRRIWQLTKQTNQHKQRVCCCLQNYLSVLKSLVFAFCCVDVCFVMQCPSIHQSPKRTTLTFISIAVHLLAFTRTCRTRCR